jgi:predicted amidohydrolase YtcJ
MSAPTADRWERPVPAHHDDVTLYLNGLVWPGLTQRPEHAHRREGLAVRDGRVAAVGGNRELTQAFGSHSHVVDLGGRRVIPGLIDGHNHVVRGGLTWRRELDWTGLRSREAALTVLARAVAVAPAGTWISVVGGWHDTQFEDGWAPTRAELDAVAPDHPVYVQSLYHYALVNRAGLAAAGLPGASLPDGSVEVDRHGTPTGRVRGMPAYTHVLSSMGAVTLEDQIAGTRRLFGRLAARGVTGVNDPGGFGVGPEQYDAVYELWRRDRLDLRLRLFLSALDVGHELRQITAWVRHLQIGFGDDRLRIAGIGEVVHLGCHDFEGLDGFEITDEALDELEAISRVVASRRWPMQIHAVTDESISRILSRWERVNASVPIVDLRFSLAHGDRISPVNIARLARLGAGLIVDDRQVFRASASAAAWGRAALTTVPPLGDLLESRIPLGAGTDGTRASAYDPWLSLWWLVAGRPLDGSSQRQARHRLSREQSLHLWTSGNTWFTFEERERGRLTVGQRADFAVLDQDYFLVDTHAIPTLRSELTVLGGRVTHSTGVLGEAVLAEAALV